MQQNAGKILVIDDSEPNRYVKARTLKMEGFHVVEAATGVDGLAVLHRESPDLVLLDVKLPDINGLEVCKRIKAMPQFAAVPVVQTSASFVDATHRARGLEGGADTYLVEPTDPVILIATVNSLLRLRRAERDRAEMLIRETAARKEAEHANRTKDEFLATLSHELRTPLAAIIGWSEILLRSKNMEPEKVQHGLSVIHRNAKVQGQLIEDLLDVSRIISGKLLIEQTSFDLAAVVTAAVDAVKISMNAKQIKCMLSLCTEEARVVGDSARLQQAVWNLLSNSVKFTPKNGSIDVSLVRKNDLAEIIVSDTGAGIKPEFLPHLFERFTQADSSSIREHGGLGIGLSLVRSLTELHGGTVRAESPGPGLGATFTMSIPIAVAAPEKPPSTRFLKPGAAAGKISLQGVSILIVDDDVDTREIMTVILRGAGAETRDVNSADEAIAEYKRAMPHIIISDIGMPGKDGIALIKEIRSLENGQVPAIAVTAFAHDEDTRRSLESGYQHHMAKPVDPDLLLAMIRIVIAGA